MMTVLHIPAHPVKSSDHFTRGVCNQVARLIAMEAKSIASTQSCFEESFTSNWLSTRPRLEAMRNNAFGRSGIKGYTVSGYAIRMRYLHGPSDGDSDGIASCNKGLWMLVGDKRRVNVLDTSMQNIVWEGNMRSGDVLIVANGYRIQVPVFPLQKGSDSVLFGWDMLSSLECQKNT